MANVKKVNRVQDTDIKRLNHVGLGLKAIAQILGCHPATITLRLEAMGVKPTDTRRSFMERVFMALPNDVQDWLSNDLYNNGIGIQEFVTKLIVDRYEGCDRVVSAAPAPMPELLSSGEPGILQVGTVPLEQLIGETPLDPVAVAVEPEYVEETLKTPVCGACHKSPVESEEALCVSCQTPPETRPANLFG